jgi:hypothetical protein
MTTADFSLPVSPLVHHVEVPYGITTKEPESTHRILVINVDPEHADYMELAVDIEAGRVTVIGVFTIEGDTLVAGSVDIDGPGARMVGRPALKSMAIALGKEWGVARVVIYPKARTTGANPGRIPGPFKFDVH